MKLRVVLLSACLAAAPIYTGVLPADAQGSVAVEIARAETLVAQGEYAPALTAARNAARRAPNDHRARYYAGMALLGLQRFEEALVEANAALRFAPEAEKSAVQKLVAAIDLQKGALTAEADAQAAMESGLVARAARLYAQAFDADSSKVEAGFKAASLYAGTLNQPKDAALILRRIIDKSPGGETPVTAQAELDKLAPKIRPLVSGLLTKAAAAIESGMASEAGQYLDELEALEPANKLAALERVRTVALVDDDQALEQALMGLNRRGVQIDSVIHYIPRAVHWANQPWLGALLADYRGADYAQTVIASLRSGSTQSRAPERTSAELARRPTAEDLGRFYPERAQRLGQSGQATIVCVVSATGALSGCSIESESPPDLGFGDATIRASRLFKMKPETLFGEPVDGGTVRIPFEWALASSN